MTSPLFRKLLVGALALFLATSGAVYFVLASLPSIPASAPVVILVILSVAVMIAFVIGLFVARSLTRRVSRLKRISEGLLGVPPDLRLATDSGDDLTALERSMTAVAKEVRALVENLRFESARRDAVLSGMTEGVLAVDADLRVTFCNEALLRAADYRDRNFEGRPLLEIVRNPELTTVIRTVLASGEPQIMRLKLAADTPRTFEVNVSPFAVASGKGVLAILHDTTDLERLEQVRKDFVANVSHELRTPLAGIIGYADTLLDGALEDADNRRRFVEIIRANAVRLGTIVGDLLVLSEIESGTESEPEMVSVRGVLDAVLQTLESEAQARGVRLIRAEIEDVYVLGSRLRLEQALLNLLANAIKFNRPDGDVQASVQRTPDGRISIRISDTGTGIPFEDLPRIFERFYRVDKARSRQVGGTGLGLSIVRHIVERMNGTISVESQLGKGSTFTVSLPSAH
jgi:two-component system, OmpR family, phosphate regulon sensor histidine kinase PhoR